MLRRCTIIANKPPFLSLTFWPRVTGVTKDEISSEWAALGDRNVNETRTCSSQSPLGLMTSLHGVLKFPDFFNYCRLFPLPREEILEFCSQAKFVENNS